MTDAPAIDEMLWSTQDNTPVYYDPKITAERVRSNYENDQSFHEFRKGDQIGTLLDDGKIPDDAGNLFYKVKVWQWKRKGLALFSSFENYQEFFDAYVRVDHEPAQWIRQSRKDAYQQGQEKATTDADVEGYISALQGVPQPIEIKKEDDGTIRLTFANGYSTTFKEFKTLSAEAVRTLTLRDPTKEVKTTVPKTTVTGAGAAGDGSGKILTTNVILIGLGSLVAFGLLIFLTLRKK
jgi:hypothetical protein